MTSNLKLKLAGEWEVVALEVPKISHLILVLLKNQLQLNIGTIRQLNS